MTDGKQKNTLDMQGWQEDLLSPGKLISISSILDHPGIKKSQNVENVS